MPSAHLRRSSKYDEDRRIIGAKHSEFESADAFGNLGAWGATSHFLLQHVPNPPDPNIIRTVFLDTINADGTPRFDLWNADGQTLRDRPKKQAGTRFHPDEFIYKALNEVYTNAALEIVQRVSLRPDSASAKVVVRDEIEEEHPKPRDEGRSFYTFDDLSSGIQSRLEDKMGREIHDAKFAPVFTVYVRRQKYPFMVNPDAESEADLILPISHKIDSHSHHVRIQIGMDQWVAKQPPVGVSIYEVLNTAEKDSGHFKFILGGLSAEREARLAESGGAVTDRDAVVAYIRVGDVIYRIGKEHPNEDGSLALRPMESKAKEIFTALQYSRR